MRDFTPKEEIQFLETLIKLLKNRGFAWDMYLRPFRILYYKLRIKRLNKMLQYTGD